MYVVRGRKMPLAFNSSCFPHLWNAAYATYNVSEVFTQLSLAAKFEFPDIVSQCQDSRIIIFFSQFQVRPNDQT